MTEMENPFEQEARERWGDTAAWKESRRRSRSYSPEQVGIIKAELESIESDFAGLLGDGVAPDSPEATDVAERARLPIDRWYYPCTTAMHLALSGMYVEDPRFRAHYDERLPGLAEFVAAAIRANAESADARS